MLPSSHFEPIMLPHVVKDNEDGRQLCLTELLDDESCSYVAHGSMGSRNRPHSVELLASEFSEFISAASRLEQSYRFLQQQVSELDLELSARNAELRASLKENERMRLALEHVVDSMPCGILVLDRDGSITMLNPESRRLLGFVSEEKSDELMETLHQFSLTGGVKVEATNAGSSSEDLGRELCVSDSEGKRWLDVRKRELYDLSRPGDVPDQKIIILRDITTQKRAEEEREAGRKAMALAEITLVLAHEIRNPLASLELFAELIEKDKEHSDEWISNLRAGIRTLSGTVNNVLSFHGSGSVQLAPLSLSAFLRNAICFIQPLADQSAITLEFVGHDDRAVVMGNEIALQQVVLNLISNAIRFTAPGGKVILSLHRETSNSPSPDVPESYVVLEFTDTGAGIKPEEIEHVFEPGFSGNGDTSGLGLAVCDRIMKQHHGCISASNGATTGARFSLHFPSVERELVTG